MQVVKGNKIENFSPEQLKLLAQKFDNVELDLGTGDGRFVFMNAQKYPQTLFIGVDPSQKQLEIYSKKALRAKLNNALFVIGSIEVIPFMVEGFLSKIYILLPWGSLLKETLDVDSTNIFVWEKMLKNKGYIELILGYDEKFEPTEVERLGLKGLTADEISNGLQRKYDKSTLSVKDVTELNKTQLKEINTTWGNKLAFGKDRKMFRVLLQKNH